MQPSIGMLCLYDIRSLLLYIPSTICTTNHFSGSVGAPLLSYGSSCPVVNPAGVVVSDGNLMRVMKFYGIFANRISTPLSRMQLFFLVEYSCPPAQWYIESLIFIK